MIGYILLLLNFSIIDNKNMFSIKVSVNDVRTRKLKIQKNSKYNYGRHVSFIIYKLQIHFNE